MAEYGTLWLLFYNRCYKIYIKQKTEKEAGASVCSEQPMGRTKYSEEERHRIITNFLRCTREIIDFEGIEQVSIRKVSQKAGFNSASIYLYFKDADELITLASIGYLESYCRKLSADMPLLQTPQDIYMHTWRVFGMHAFDHPQVFHHLFFYPHSVPLNEIVSRYYEVYPHQLGETDGTVRQMLLAGPLEERNMRVLRPLTQEMGLDEKETEQINDLTICYFKKLLEQSGREPGTLAMDHQVQKLMDVIELLFRIEHHDN